MYEQTQTFEKTFGDYKERIEHSIDRFASGFEETGRDYGSIVNAPTAAALDILQAPGKRVRGALTIASYEMLGGEDAEMIDTAAAAMEALQAYLVVIDDLQDDAKERRGILPAHLQIERDLDHLSNKPKQLPRVYEGVAINAGLGLGHYAGYIIGSLPDVRDRYKLQARNVVDKAMVVTGFGQTADMLGPHFPDISDTEIERANADKTKHYTFRAPLEVGVHLAGAEQQDIGALTLFADYLGTAYQIKNDLEVVDATLDRKDRGEDIRLNKRTLPLRYALSEESNLSDEQKQRLKDKLGNPDLSRAEVIKCQQLLVESGAKEYVEEILNDQVSSAMATIEDNVRPHWKQDKLEFLKSLGYLATA